MWAIPPYLPSWFSLSARMLSSGWKESSPMSSKAISRVTAVIPNYNHARFLAQRIESVLNQTYPDLAVLYLDDASTDNSAEIFARYAGDPRISSIGNAQNS